MMSNVFKSKTSFTKNLFNLFVVTNLLIFTISCKKDVDSLTKSELIKSKIISVFDSVLNNTHVPGIVAGVWAPDEGIELIYTGGFSNLETNASMNADMVFRIGSNTKTMSVTILLTLVDQKIIALEDKLSKYLPDFPRADEVTIEMLCNMRSGIYNYSDNLDFYNNLVQNPSHVWSFDELLSYPINNNYYFDPDSGYHYSNSNTIIIGKIVEEITNKTLGNLITEKIITPLGLEKTEYLTSGIDLPGYHSKAYYFQEYDPDNPEYTEYFDVSWAGPAGSAISTLEELKEYVITLVGGGFLSPELQQRRLNSMIPMENPWGVTYGIGMFEYKGFYGHNGSLPGYSSLMIHSPSKNCTIVIWYNSQLPDNPTNLLPIIPHLIYSNL